MSADPYGRANWSRHPKPRERMTEARVAEIKRLVEVGAATSGHVHELLTELEQVKLDAIRGAGEAYRNGIEQAAVKAESMRVDHPITGSVYSGSVEAEIRRLA